MSHCCEILTFDAETDKREIVADCCEWGSHHCDYEECGGNVDIVPNFTSQIFDSYADACAFLEKTFGGYHQTAVRYKKYPKFKTTKAMESINEQIDKYVKFIAELNKPHYANPNIKSKTIKCKSCGSTLNISYCGKTFSNECPVCRADLRPTSTLDKVASYKAKIDELRKKYRQLEKAEQKKLEGKSTLCWAVACEVHC